MIRSMNLDGSEALFLRATRDTKAERVGVPWMAMEVGAAQLAIKYAISTAGQALEQRRANHRRDLPLPRGR
ncbi:hypothetical protein ACH444_36760 [Streptomyces microflavus]|uniref:hypothetical protein n=1 Tax=Streptomyces microflavus TaxID=1919 RepID=UPI0037BB5C32